MGLMADRKVELKVVDVDGAWDWLDIERVLRQWERQGWLHLYDTAAIVESPPPLELKPSVIIFWRSAIPAPDQV